MADIKQIKVNDIIYDIKDAQARTELQTKISVSEKGVAGGVATLDEDAKVPASQLPSGFTQLALEYKVESNCLYLGLA